MAREWSTEETDAVLDQIDNLYEGLEYDPGNFHVSGELWAVDTPAGIECKAYVDTETSVSANQPTYHSYRAYVRVSPTQSTAVPYSRSTEALNTAEEAIEQARAGLAYAWRNRTQLVER